MMVSYKLTSDVIGKFTKGTLKSAVRGRKRKLQLKIDLLPESPEKQKISHSIIPYYLQVFIASKNHEFDQR